MQIATDHLNEWLNNELKPGNGIKCAKEENRYKRQYARNQESPPSSGIRVSNRTLRDVAYSPGQGRVGLIDNRQSSDNRDHEGDEIPTVRGVGILKWDETSMLV